MFLSIGTLKNPAAKNVPQLTVVLRYEIHGLTLFLDNIMVSLI